MTDSAASLSDSALAFIKLLAHDVRWVILRALAAGDHQVRELAALTGQPMNLVSYHLKQLRDDALVTVRRSESDGRDVYYSLDLDALRTRFHAAGLELHPAVVAGPAIVLPPPDASPPRVLFICTHNSARSQMAEALMRRMSDGRVQAFSAGSQPGAIHPDTARALVPFGADLSGQWSKPLSTFAGQSFDYVITVCDLARETCPRFEGTSVYLHWGFADPVRIADAEARRAAFEQTAQRLRTRIAHFLAGLGAAQATPGFSQHGS
jgi:protein-tyrosine-phosphatase/DNA-binding transcriptional ArsR family regulator